MRPIQQNQVRLHADLTTLEASKAAISGLPEAERSQFIAAHEAECSALRKALWITGNGKCWYSEAPLQECQGQVEHYRPKKRLHGAQHKGYWWRAFDWRNLKLAHPTVNRRKTDYLTGKRVGKGSFFPLKDENSRANDLAGERYESPVLLDPAIPFDTRLICFDKTSGAPKPRFSEAADPWLNRRALESIDYYHLNEGRWNGERADLMGAVEILCNNLETEAMRTPRDNNAYNQLIDDILKFINPTAPFSAACMQVVCEKGLSNHFTSGI